MYVGLPKKFSIGNTFLRGNYPLCGQYKENSIGVFKINIFCENAKIGQYVLLQQIRQLSYFNFAEVEVLGDRTECYNDYLGINFLGVTHPDRKKYTCSLANNYPNIDNPVSVNLALGRPVFASSLFLDPLYNAACNVVDGNANANYYSSSCFITNVQTVAIPNWVAVDLEATYSIDYVVVYNRLDATDNTLNYLAVALLSNWTIPSVQMARGALKLCGQYLYTTDSVARLVIKCGQLETIGRYVVVQNTWNAGSMCLCELEVYGTAADLQPIIFSNLTYPDNLTLSCPLYPGYPNKLVNPVRPNLALGRPVYVSSSYPDATSFPCVTVDGYPHGDYYSAKTCHSSNDLNRNWIVVDLQNIYRITSFVISNMAINGMDARLSYLVTGVLLKFISGVTQMYRGSYQVCGQYWGSTAGVLKLIVPCNDQEPVGRYAVVQSTAQNTNNMIVCEIEVFGQLLSTINLTRPAFNNLTYPDSKQFTCPIYKGYPNNIDNPVGVNLALGRPVFAGINYPNEYSSPCNAVDGNACGYYPDKTCFKLNESIGASNMLIIDLQSIYSVSRVVISNRMDVIGEESYLSDVYVGVTNFYTEGTVVARGSYPLCARYPGSSLGKVKVAVNCSPATPPARYVIIQQTETMNNMNICEVEIFGAGV